MCESGGGDSGVDLRSGCVRGQRDGVGKLESLKVRKWRRDSEETCGRPGAGSGDPRTARKIACTRFREPRATQFAEQRHRLESEPSTVMQLDGYSVATTANM